MDIARPDISRKKRRRRIWLATIAVLAIAGVSIAVSRLRPAPPTVTGAWIEHVHRGDLVINVRGLGKLVPKNILFIPAAGEGRVVQRLLEPGAIVHPHTLLLRLSNPQLQQAAASARFNLAGAQATYRQLQAQLQAQLWQQESTQADLEAKYKQAEEKAATDQSLLARGLIAAFDASQDRSQAGALHQQVEDGRQSLDNTRHSIQAQLAAQAAKVQAEQTLYRLAQTQADQLNVYAGDNGVLQELPVQVGEWVTAGKILAKVAQPQHLKAQIEIPENQARDIAIGQPASIDTHNGLIPGHVLRIDPAVQNGSVLVDVSLDGALPPGARPDLSVEGTIRLARLSNVLYVGRPAEARRNSSISLFKVLPDRTAVRVRVDLGLTSVGEVQIVRGLRAGDAVILSDMSAWDGYNRVRVGS